MEGGVDPLVLPFAQFKANLYLKSLNSCSLFGEPFRNSKLKKLMACMGWFSRVKYGDEVAGYAMLAVKVLGEM